MATVGPWNTANLISIYHLSASQFHPPMSPAAFEALLVFLLEDIEVDVKYYVTETVYATHSTDSDFAKKLQRCMALCLINDMYREHGMLLSTGGQIASESIPDFANVSYRYPTITQTHSALNKTRKELILDILSRWIPEDAPVQPVGPTTLPHGDFMYFENVEDQIDVNPEYNG